MFTLPQFAKMIADRERLDAHVRALQRLVTPASVVIDIGAGTGVMSLLACQAGARRVHAIEPSSAVQILAQAARDNGFAERVVIHQCRSTEVTLPERADVIVSDLRGVLPPHGTHFEDIADARERLLAPGGRLVPAADTLWAAVISASEVFEERRAVWHGAPHGLDLRSAQPYADNFMERLRAQREQLLSAPIEWARLDYPAPVARAVRGRGTCIVAKAGVAHGLCVWFDAELVDGVGYSNAPGAPETSIYGQIFFPWPESVALAPGDHVTFELRADPVGSEYVWTWSTEVSRVPGAGAAPAVTRFRQSTFKSWPVAPASLRTRAPGWTPVLSPAGAEVLEVLEGMRAGRTLGELAARLCAAHPRRFSSVDDARDFVVELSRRYAE
jgi:protein arginine N-methyltransferase 1